ncbi:hypothetical protein Q3G72_015539 [Acer saccharum]|nr:hypothetical protein Q3G72_015539 [Acer saccharum]
MAMELTLSKSDGVAFDLQDKDAFLRNYAISHQQFLELGFEVDQVQTGVIQLLISWMVRMAKMVVAVLLGVIARMMLASRTLYCRTLAILYLHRHCKFHKCQFHKEAVEAEAEFHKCQADSEADSEAEAEVEVEEFEAEAKDEIF